MKLILPNITWDVFVKNKLFKCNGSKIGTSFFH